MIIHIAELDFYYIQELKSMLLAAAVQGFLGAAADAQSRVCLWRQASNKGLRAEGQRPLDLLPMQDAAAVAARPFSAVILFTNQG